MVYKTRRGDGGFFEIGVFRLLTHYLCCGRMWAEYIRGNRTGSMAKGHEATGTSTKTSNALQTYPGSRRLAGLKGAFEALKEVPRAYKEAVEAQNKINVNDGRSFAERQIDRLGKTLAARQEVTKTKRQELAQGTGKEVGPRATARLLGRQIVDSVMRGAYEKAVEYNAAVVEARVEHLPRGAEKTQQVVGEAAPVETQDNGASHIVSMPNGEASTGAIYNIVPPAPAPTEADLRTAAEDTVRKEQKAALIEARNSALRNIVHAETDDDAKAIRDQAYDGIVAMAGDDETRISMLDAIEATYAKRVAHPEMYEFARRSARGDFAQSEPVPVEVPKVESAESQNSNSSHEQSDSAANRTAAVEAAQAVEEKKIGWKERMQKIKQAIGEKATRTKERMIAWLDSEDWGSGEPESPKTSSENHSESMSKAPSHEQSQTQAATPQETQPTPDSKVAEVIDLNHAAGIPDRKKPKPSEFDLFSVDFRNHIAELGMSITQAQTQEEATNKKADAWEEVKHFVEEANKKFPDRHFQIYQIAIATKQNLLIAVKHNDELRRRLEHRAA